MGPGAAIKAVTGRYFSLTVFGFSQIVMDLEPLLHILRRDSFFHGVTHTYLGATLIGLLCYLTGRRPCQWLLRWWNDLVNARYLRWLQTDASINRCATATGAGLGAWSHVLLDSLIHPDVQPFWPFSPANGLLHLLPAAWVYLLCAALGIAGLIVLAAIGLWSRWAIEIE